MKDSYEMSQCTLRRDNPDGSSSFYTSWLPSVKVAVGKTVTIKEEGSWKVVGIHSKADSRDVIADSRDHLKHREATDI